MTTNKYPYGYWRNKPHIKLRKKFTELMSAQISLQCSQDLLSEVVALAYLRGYGGKYAGLVRVLLQREVRRYVAVDLDPEERAEYERILENVKTGVKVTHMERMKRQREAIAMAGAHINEREDAMPEGVVPQLQDFDPEELDK